jgi:hypothetical protein
LGLVGLGGGVEDRRRGGKLKKKKMKMKRKEKSYYFCSVNTLT